MSVSGVARAERATRIQAHVPTKTFGMNSFPKYFHMSPATGACPDRIRSTPKLQGFQRLGGLWAGVVALGLTNSNDTMGVMAFRPGQGNVE